MKQKIKLRDLTKKQFKEWEENECCRDIECDKCPFGLVNCNRRSKHFWLLNKDMFSDKFLDKEIVIEVKGFELLTNWEKLYLEGEIKPFKDIVKYIVKRNSRDTIEQYIMVMLTSGNWDILLKFDENKRYKNLEIDKEYTLKELGLFKEKK